MAQAPLSGIRIIDLTRLLPGPLATQYLADLGAEVIKIEDIDFPDYARFFPPHVGSESVHYLSVNRSKKSLALKLGTEAGKNVFFDLVRQADIVLEGFRPGRIAAMGLGYEKAREVNPGIIYVSVTGYGQTGPLAHQAGHDLNYAGYAGVVSLGGSDGRPAMPGVQIADIMGGSYNAVIASLTALFDRMRTGKGQWVDVSMTDGALQMATMPLAQVMNTGGSFGPGQFLLSGALANYNLYECGDGRYVALGALEPKFWTGFCKLAGKPEWVAEAFGGPEKSEKLKTQLSGLFKTRTRDEWVALGAEADVCLTPVLTLDEIPDHPHFRERGMLTEHEHPVYGKVRGANQPLKFSASQLPEGWAPPLLGEHSAEVLRGAGFDETRINSLLESGVVRQG